MTLNPQAVLTLLNRPLVLNAFQFHSFFGGFFLFFFLKAACLTLQQAHEEARQRHGEDGLRAEVGQDGGEGRHGPPGCRRQQEDLLTSHAVETA